MKEAPLYLSLLLLCTPNAPATDDCASLAETPIKEREGVISQHPFARGQLRNFIKKYPSRVRYDEYTQEVMEKLNLSKEDIESVLRTTNSIVPQDDDGKTFRAIGRSRENLQLELSFTVEHSQGNLVIKSVRKLIRYEASVVVDGQLLPVSQLSPGQFQQAVGTFFETGKVHYSRNVHRNMREGNISQEDIEYVLRNVIQLTNSPRDDDPNFFQAIGSTREIPWLSVFIDFSYIRKTLIIVGAKRIE